MFVNLVGIEFAPLDHSVGNLKRSQKISKDHWVDAARYSICCFYMQSAIRRAPDVLLQPNHRFSVPRGLLPVMFHLPHPLGVLPRLVVSLLA
jgi:hypothetical protein